MIKTDSRRVLRSTALDEKVELGEVMALTPAQLLQARDQIDVELGITPHLPNMCANGLLPTVAALSRHELKQYSLAKLIRDRADRVAGPTLEREVSDGIAADLNTTPAHGGYFVPLRMSGLDTKTNAGGGYLTQTTVPRSILDALTAQSRLLQLGARLLSGLRFAQSFPVETTAITAAWVQENSGTDISHSDPSVGNVCITPHPMAASTSVSRQLLQQSSSDVERG